MTKSVTKSLRCSFCKKKFPWRGRGRRPRYCSRSHRQRAYEARRLQRIANNPVSLVKRDINEMKFRGAVRRIVLHVLQDLGLIPKTERTASVLKVLPRQKDGAQEKKE